MTRLDPGDFAALKPIIPNNREAGHMAFVHAVLDGTLPGTVFAAGAGSAIVCPAAGFWFAIGKPNAELAAEVRDWAVAGRHFGSEWAVWASTQAWGETLAPMAGSYNERREYHFGGLPRNAPRVPKGVELRPLDLALLGGFEGRVDPWVIGVWGGPEAMMAKSFGFAAVAEGQVGAICAACAIGGPPGAVEAEIEIGTATMSRRAGLATACGYAFIAECLDRELVPAWTCTATNVASDATARKLGFSWFRTIRGYVIT